ncbi:conserved hypothetical protein [Pyrenophora tritici-repentis Pt-1C-BFP]|uniref:Nucleotide-diphospho-sugar transferase domain-containing protein n=1 Tax=Pyrenophora tritici-repentis (strain Pt-1C-BFP) TaxID=426418 RepID=B2VYU7_PYRTR|nr:uncharacterized protein PTRG_02587 [Pyrenophora tritici-repentis Pt-1C-BFP]EDU45110.1 conserved hypothetical protein [Pyrenophora tritici-repentis Pt-1C-BFP]
MSFNKLGLTSGLFIAICLLIISTSAGLHMGGSDVLGKIKESAKDTKNHLCNSDKLGSGDSIGSAFWKLYEHIRHPIGESTYKDQGGRIHGVHEDAPWWTEPLKNQVLIVDIDTRIPNKKGALWNETRMDWETLSAEGYQGVGSASFMNHFYYSKIHGYDYKFINAHDMGEGIHNTWVKPHILYALLKSYKFVVFIDADATFQHLEVPLEWLFNRWGITPKTSVAMPVDTREDRDGDTHVSEDSRGRTVLNSGFIVAQALPYTFDMFTAWKECPTGTRYPDCNHWADVWSHEQRAFSEYIRYDFNPNGTNIVEIACDDAMGYPGIIENETIVSNCTGQFIRHHTLDKSMTKKSTQIAMMQSLTDLLHQELHDNNNTYMVKEKQNDTLVANHKNTAPSLPKPLAYMYLLER